MATPSPIARRSTFSPPAVDETWKRHERTIDHSRRYRRRLARWPAASSPHDDRDAGRGLGPCRTEHCRAACRQRSPSAHVYVEGLRAACTFAREQFGQDVRELNSVQMSELLVAAPRSVARVFPPTKSRASGCVRKAFISAMRACAQAHRFSRAVVAERRLPGLLDQPQGALQTMKNDSRFIARCREIVSCQASADLDRRPVGAMPPAARPCRPSTPRLAKRSRTFPAGGQADADEAGQGFRSPRVSRLEEDHALRPRQAAAQRAAALIEKHGDEFRAVDHQSKTASRSEKPSVKSPRP